MTATTHADTPSASRTDVVAFVSPVGGSGQTSIVANIAWVLAAAGKRVLVLDWGATSPLAADYLGPFQIDHSRAVPALEAALEFLAGTRPGGAPPRVERYAPPHAGAGGMIEIITVHDRDQIPPVLPARPGDGARLRRLLRDSGYDYVLIDSPVASSQAALTQLAHLCDSIVVCFRSHNRFRPMAAQLARALITASPVRLRLVAVPTQLGQDPYRASEQLRLITEAFAGLPETTDGGFPVEVRIVCMPYHPYDIYEEYLAVILDDGETRRSLLEIVEVICAGTVTALPSIDSRVRDRYRRRFAEITAEPPDAVETIYLNYAAGHRSWADWVGEQLRQEDVLALRRSVDDDSWLDDQRPAEVVLIGDRPLADERIRRLIERAGVDRGRILRIRVGEESVSSFDPKLPVLDLADERETSARNLVRAHFGLIAPPRGEPHRHFQPRFPGRPDGPRPAQVTNLSARSALFMGRTADLERLRDQLLEPGAGPQVLTGPAGVGKSELAREYCHRFTDDYDVIWWIAADSRASIHAALRQLGDRLQQHDLVAGLSEAALSADPGDDLGYGSSGVLSALADPPAPWSHLLLVYDNLADLSDLSLLPHGGPAHVLITTRNGVAPTGGGLVPVGRLGSRDSVALLQGYVPDLTADDALAVADVVERLPLTLRVVGAWLRELVALSLQRAPATALATAAAAATLLREQVEASAGAADPALAALQGTWLALRHSLWQTTAGPAAARLAELCVYLSSDRISLALLRSGPMVEALLRALGDDSARLADDPIEFDRVLWTGVRFGIFDIDWGAQRVLRVHHAIQEAIRDSLSREEQELRQRQVQLALARYAPGISEGDETEQSQRLDELQHHLLSSGAAEATDREVRRWVVRQVRYMALQQVATVTAVALEICEQALAAWAGEPDEPTTMWLQVERANILRWQGRQPEAHDVDREVRRRQSRVQGADHLRTLITARGLAGDLRALGRYDGARRHDSVAYHGFGLALGEEHHQTLMTAHNFALSSFLDGDLHIAMVTEQAVLERRLRLSGEADPFSWWSAASLGTYQRELGDLDGAMRTLTEADGWISKVYGGVIPDHPNVLRVWRSLAVARRLRNQAAIAKDDNARVLQAYRRLSRDEHPDTWACRLALAADHHVLGESGEAVQIARRSLEHYEANRSFGPDHPLTALCRANLAIYLRGVGEVGEALGAGERAWHTLRATLSSETHPWILAAMINQVGHLAVGGQAAAALDLARQAVEWCREDLAVAHPYTRAAEHNLLLIQTVRPGSTPARLPYQDLDVDVPQT